MTIERLLEAVGAAVELISCDGGYGVLTFEFFFLSFFGSRAAIILVKDKSELGQSG